MKRAALQAAAALAIALIITLLVIMAPGCTALQPSLFTKEMSDATRQIATGITDQAVWQHMLADVDAEAVEPGIEAQIGVLYVIRMKLTGVAGHMGISGSGSGSGAGNSPETAAILRELGRNPDIAKIIAEKLREAQLGPTTRPAPP